MEGYSFLSGLRADSVHVDDYVDFTPSSVKGAALSVAMLIAGATLFLIILKRSGFRAMVAVGRS